MQSAFKHTLSKTDKDCSTRFLERDEVILPCSYHTSYDEKGLPSNVNCGDWCPMFDLQLPEKGFEVPAKVYLLCGSGNAVFDVKV